MIISFRNNEAFCIDIVLTENKVAYTNSLLTSLVIFPVTKAVDIFSSKCNNSVFMVCYR